MINNLLLTWKQKSVKLRFTKSFDNLCTFQNFLKNPHFATVCISDVSTSFVEEFSKIKNLEMSQKSKYSWKFVYILAKQCRSPFNLTNVCQIKILILCGFEIFTQTCWVTLYMTFFKTSSLINKLLIFFAVMNCRLQNVTSQWGEFYGRFGFLLGTRQF